MNVKYLISLLVCFAAGVRAADLNCTVNNVGAGTAYFVGTYWRNSPTPEGGTTFDGNHPDIASGGSQLFVGTGLGGLTASYIWVSCYTNAAHTGNVNWFGPFGPLNFGTPQTVNINPGGDAPPTYSIKFCGANMRESFVTYALFKNGDFAGYPNLMLWPKGDPARRDVNCITWTLPPGETTNGYYVKERVCDLVNDGFGGVTLGNCYGTGSDMPFTVGTNSTPLSVTNYNQPEVTGTFDASTNNPVLFNATNEMQVMQQATQALFDEARKAHLDAVMDAQRIQKNQTDQTAKLTSIDSRLSIANTTLTSIDTKAGQIKSAIDNLTAVTAAGTNSGSGQTVLNTSNTVVRLTAIANTVSNSDLSLTAIKNNSTMLPAISNTLYHIDAVATTSQGLLTDLKGKGDTIAGEIVTMRDRMHGDLQGVTNFISGAAGTAHQDAIAMTNMLAGISNAIAGQGTNEFGVRRAVENFHGDNTNLLGQIRDLLGQSNSVDIADLTGATNLDATTMGTTAIASETAKVNDLISQLGDAPTGSYDGGGSPAGLSFEFMGNTVSLDPAVRFPGVPAFIKMLITFLSTIAFIYSMSVVFRETAQTYATAEQGGAPNLTFLGNNPIGIAAVPFLALFFIATWVLVFVAFFAIATPLVMSFGGFSAPSAPSEIAVYLIDLFVPVNLLLAFAWTRIMANFVVGKAMMLARSVSQFIIK